MAINFFDTVQISTVLNAIVAQAAGASALAQVDTKDFVAVAKIGLEAGYDKLSTAISQLLTRTIYSNRPYSEKLKIMDVDQFQYGNHIRKIQFLDSDWEDNDAYKLTNGQSIDAWEVRKPQAVQTNFYGTITAERWVTIYRDQLKQAMTGPQEFGSFFSALMTNLQDQVVMKNEECKRMCLCNLIGGTIGNGIASQNIKLVTEYNVAIGSPSPALTLTDLLDPQYFPDFARWIFGRIATAVRAMSDRTVLFHQNPTNATPVSGNVHRHTPAQDLNMVLFAPFFDRIDSNVLSTTFNDKYLKLTRHEFVNYWQNAASPESIYIDAAFTKNDGTIDNAVFNSDLVLGVLFDRETAGVSLIGDDAADSVYNARGKYYNHFVSFESRYYNDNFENCIVLTLD